MAALALAVVLGGPRGVVRAQEPPAVVATLELKSLAGDWYEVSSAGDWWHRRCVSDTRYRFEVEGPRALRVVSFCTTPAGTLRQRGRLRAAPGGDGRLSIGFAPAVFAWLPATWGDYWVLAAADDWRWLLVGDDRRERLSIVSRTVFLDEGAVAQALAAARKAGYDVARLVPTPHPTGAMGLWPGAD